MSLNVAQENFFFQFITFLFIYKTTQHYMLFHYILPMCGRLMQRRRQKKLSRLLFACSLACFALLFDAYSVASTVYLSTTMRWRWRSDVSSNKLSLVSFYSSSFLLLSSFLYFIDIFSDSKHKIPSHFFLNFIINFFCLIF